MALWRHKATALLCTHDITADTCLKSQESVLDSSRPYLNIFVHSSRDEEEMMQCFKKLVDFNLKTGYKKKLFDQSFCPHFPGVKQHQVHSLICDYNEAKFEV